MSTVLYTCYVLLLLIHPISSIDKLVSIIKSFVDTGIYDTIVVSVCCGRAETEANCDPRVLCVCLDSDGSSLYASKVAMEQTVEAVQIHGGNGFVKDYHVERLMRDAKITQIYEGTSEIQKIVISRGVIKG